MGKDYSRGCLHSDIIRGMRLAGTLSIMNMSPDRLAVAATSWASLLQFLPAKEHLCDANPSNTELMSRITP